MLRAVFGIAAIVTVLACDEAGVITGGEILHEGKLNKRQRDLVEYALATEICPEIEAHLGKECTQEGIRDFMRVFRMEWVDDEVFFRAKFEKPE